MIADSVPAARAPGGVSISVIDLVVRYDTPAGTVDALTLPGLEIDAGTSLAIMGPSGCGKSTLLGLLAGLAIPTGGRVTVGDAIVSDLDEGDRVRFRRRSIGMIYQADNLLPHLTVEENIALAPAIVGRQGDDPGELIDRLGLGELRERFPDQLSGGQRQRVAVARAVVSRPPLILADEPTGSLDETNSARVIELLLDARRSIGATLVVVTHHPTVAALLDRVEYLERPNRPHEATHVG